LQKGNHKVDVSEEISILVERTLDGVLLRIVKPGNGDIYTLLLPFDTANKIGRLLIAHSTAGRIEYEMLLKKLTEMEQEIIAYKKQHAHREESRRTSS